MFIRFLGHGLWRLERAGRLDLQLVQGQYSLFQPFGLNDGRDGHPTGKPYALALVSYSRRRDQFLNPAGVADKVWGWLLLTTCLFSLKDDWR